jgi:hypothetical protein
MSGPPLFHALDRALVLTQRSSQDHEQDQDGEDEEREGFAIVTQFGSTFARKGLILGSSPNEAAV